MDMRAAALAMARRGHRVFRLKPGTKDGFLDKSWSTAATSDPAEVFDLWTKADGSPEDYNFGVAGGGDLVILDVDLKTDKQTGEVLVDGFLSLPDLGELPDTFRVRTPNGGEHIYFSAGGELFGQARAAVGIDVRAVGGFVVGPGSIFEGKRYEVARDTKPAPVPASVAERLRIAAARAASAGSTLGDVDTDAAMNAAIRYLQETAPEGVEGGRDNTCFKVACRVVDFGISEAVCYGLMDEHWTCDYTDEGPNAFTHDDLRRCVWSAVHNRKQAVGIDNPTFGFRPVPQEIIDAPSDTALRIRRFRHNAETAKAIPKRPWLAFRRLIRGKITSLVAPPSAGKSLLSAQWAASIALGNGDFCGLQVADRCDALIINNEDEHDEIDRRLVAVIEHFKLNYAEVYDRVHILSGVGSPFKVVRRANSGRWLSQSRELGEVIEYVRKHKIGLIVVDPLATTTEGEENSNSDSEFTMEAYRKLAFETNAAVLMVHHTRKPPAASSDNYAGNMDAGRGASAAIAAARVGLTLFGMSEKDAERYGVAPHLRNKYVRLDDAKQNLALASPFAEWFEKPSVKIANGEELGVLVPVRFTEKTEHEARSIVTALYDQLAAAGEMKLKTAAGLMLGDALFRGLKPDAIARRIRKIFEAVPRLVLGADEITFEAQGKDGGLFVLTANKVN